MKKAKSTAGMLVTLVTLACAYRLSPVVAAAGAVPEIGLNGDLLARGNTHSGAIPIAGAYTTGDAAQVLTGYSFSDPLAAPARDFDGSSLLMQAAVSVAAVPTPAEYLITMSWPDGHPDDIDLYVREPDGGLAWYHHREAGPLTLDDDDRGSYRGAILVNGITIPNPGNEETVRVRDAVPGEYLVNVYHYLANGVDPVPVSVKVEQLTPTPQLIWYGIVELSGVGDEKTAIRFSLDQQGNVVSFDSSFLSLAKQAVWELRLEQDSSANPTTASTTSESSTPPEVNPMMALIAAGDPAAGRAQAAYCAGCHTFNETERTVVGPNLFDIVGRPIGGVPGFNYSTALLAANADGRRWTYEALDSFIESPAGYFPGTRMSYRGMPDDGDRADLIAYLRTLSNNPAPIQQTFDDADEADPSLSDVPLEGTARAGEWSNANDSVQRHRGHLGRSPTRVAQDQAAYNCDGPWVDLLNTPNTLFNLVGAEALERGVLTCAERGYADAQYQLGIMHLIGIAVERSQSTAFAWLRSAAELGNLAAQEELASLFAGPVGYYDQEIGTYVSRSAEGIYYAAMAAEQGSVSAQYLLGSFFFYGQGPDVPGDYVTAYMWFSIAAAAGDRFAAEELAEVSLRMTDQQIDLAEDLAESWRAHH